MSETKIYQEEIGAGIDSEASNPNGIFARVSYWEDSNLHYPVSLPGHYTIEIVVMIDREFVIERKSVFFTRYREDAKIIRRTIKQFDGIRKDYEENKGVVFEGVKS